jgi:hypothetical protein
MVRSRASGSNEADVATAAGRTATERHVAENAELMNSYYKSISADVLST